jgi:mannose-1-phosphate guanylyltransferase/mannose-6-phosphate isomerase
MVIPVILSGGSGTRLWPLSRSAHPKQFARFGDAQRTPFGETLERTKPLNAAPIVVCNADHRFMARDELKLAGIEERLIILEPFGRNTAAAVAVAAIAATETDPEAVLAVMPSDHRITDAPAFAKVLTEAAAIAAEKAFVLMGIPPDCAHTGYGYIKKGAPLPRGRGFAVEGFTEKPQQDVAEEYLATGAYYWNSGIFLLHAGTYLEELARLDQKLLAAARASLTGAIRDLGFLRLEAMAFAQCPNVSIDTAVIEKTDKAVMLPLDAGWSDLGSWSALWDAAECDEADNAVHGDALLLDSSGCYVHSPNALVATVGIKDMVIVNTPDAVLVADKSRSQNVADIVASLKKSGRTEHLNHVRCFRPWGFYETLRLDGRYQVKLLHVKPRCMLSLQMHQHRSEHWTVVRGTARVTIGDEQKLVAENESVYVPATSWHRLENPGKGPLELIEVQVGTYLGEDDIGLSYVVYNRV